MAYAICRVTKLTHSGNIAASIAHAKRERETPNADQDRTPENEIIINGDAEKIQSMAEPAMTRKDNVKCVELMLTASPEFFDGKNPAQIDEWKDRSMEWVGEKFGRENVALAIMHRDEQTPHLSVYVVPIVDGKLNAKAHLGGREKMQKLQDGYHKAVQSLGLTRGERGSVAKHQEVKKYYERAQQPLEKEPRIAYPKPDFSDRLNIDEYGLRVAKTVAAPLQKRIAELKTQIRELQQPDLVKLRRDFRGVAKRGFQMNRDLNEVKSRNRALERERQKMQTIMERRPELKQAFMNAERELRQEELQEQQKRGRGLEMER